MQILLDLLRRAQLRPLDSLWIAATSYLERVARYFANRLNRETTIYLREERRVELECNYYALARLFKTQTPSIEVPANARRPTS